MSASTSNGSLRVVLYYGGDFVVSRHTGVRKYEDKKKLNKNNVEVKKLSVEEIRDMFSDVIGPFDWLYYFHNGITPNNGYKLLERDDQVPELVYLAKRLGWVLCLGNNESEMGENGEDMPEYQSESGDDED
ncbi:hypothetical protein POM88_048526 [Heracleum sosnowskyi]|uniref:PB1-like domain-containing protein n=1 Tax=Heracleum sosnowskyi TaxID=360622 RepID=A0AAD8GWE8_9APIA|nr:hypothetical protein POM88_048526 [Heracleum sosnowskyi]